MRLFGSILILGALAVAGCSTPHGPRDHFLSSQEWRDAQTPQTVLTHLMSGNQAFKSGNWRDWDFLYEQQQTASGQYPMAVVLSCIDSRAPAELLFNLGIGDIFNARVAGNVVNSDILGSLEYACAVAGAKLILVMGHSNCGAIKSACDHVELGNITGLLDKVQPAVSGVPNVPGDRNSKNPAFVEAVAERNVGLMIHRISAESPILAQLEQEGTIAIAGSMYDVETGRVRLLQP